MNESLTEIKILEKYFSYFFMEKCKNDIFKMSFLQKIFLKFKTKL